MAAESGSGVGGVEGAPLDARLLQVVADNEGVDTLALAAQWALPHQRIVGAVNSLDCDEYVKAGSASKSVLGVTASGEEVLTVGASTEVRVFNAVPAEGAVIMEEVQDTLSKAVFSAGFGTAIKAKWLVREKKSGMLKRLVEVVSDRTLEQLQLVSSGGTLEPAVQKALEKRKLLKATCVRRAVPVRPALR